MVQLKKPHGNSGINSANRCFIKDLEPIIKKHGLENEDGCKEAIEMVKKNDPRGYHGLAIGLWTYGNLDSEEEKALFAATKNAVDNGVEEAQFCHGSLLFLGIGENQDIEGGLYIMNRAFLKLFSKAFAKYPLGSNNSDGLFAIFMTNQSSLASAVKATTKEEQIKEYQNFDTLYSYIILMLQNAISIKAIKL